MLRQLLGVFCLLTISTLGALASSIRPGQIKNLVTFGDSFTDTFWIANGGKYQWPHYASWYTNAKLYPYARSGGTCSNELTYRPFPSLFESQLPTYFNDTKSTIKLDPKKTIYTLWLGTNDVGSNALLTGSDEASLVDVMECMVNWVRVLYKSGARNFLFQNMVPLEKIPLYSPHAWYGRYWTAPRNATAWSVFMRELVTSGNKITRLSLQDLAPTLPGAHIALFDSHALFSDMYARPERYLNGTAPLNVDHTVSYCIYEENEPTSNPGRCTTVEGSDRDSYLWYDELHPSEQASRIVAREVARVIKGEKSRWTTWLS